MYCRRCQKVFKKGHKRTDLCQRCNHEHERIAKSYSKGTIAYHNAEQNFYVDFPVKEEIPVKKSNPLLDWMNKK